MGLGVFIVPNGELKSKITFWKNKIEKELHEQPYTNHPPHLTIIHSNINEHKTAINEIKECLKGLKPFKLKVHETVRILRISSSFKFLALRIYGSKDDG